jgi:NAD(P)-dependent dehydrogenase (short-subunit alcohol dehydrogenase family)
MGRLDGKVALITGGASGMGMVASKLFASEGAAIVLTDVADDAGQTVASEIGAAGGQALYVHSDVSNEADAEAMVEAAVERFGGLTILYNNAGVMMSQDGSVTDTDVAVWEASRARSKSPHSALRRFPRPKTLRSPPQSDVAASVRNRERAPDSEFADIICVEDGIDGWHKGKRERAHVHKGSSFDAERPPILCIQGEAPPKKRNCKRRRGKGSCWRDQLQ